jgi:hypothetical protein
MNVYNVPTVRACVNQNRPKNAPSGLVRISRCKYIAGGKGHSLKRSFILARGPAGDRLGWDAEALDCFPRSRTASGVVLSSHAGALAGAGIGFLLGAVVAVPWGMLCGALRGFGIAFGLREDL